MSARLLVVIAAYYVTAKVGLLLALVHTQVTPLWPPTGIALVLLYRWGLPMVPGITLGAFLINLPIGPTFWAAAQISVGNTLAPLCAYLLLKATGFRVELDRLKDALLLVFLGAFAGMVISATVGSLALLWSGVLAAGAFWQTWLVWWTGDAMGVLIVVPMALTALAGPLSWRGRRIRWLEAVLLLACTFGVALFVTLTSLRMLFLVFPFIIWAALRFQLVGATPCALIVSVLAILAAVEGTGPFAENDLVVRMATLQSFTASVALTALLLAAITRERNEARKAIDRACTQLADAVAAFPPGVDLLRGDLLKAVTQARSRAARDE
ncbi:MASE1 domain-containing protein [Allokutzneria oryzae]|uniref:MASE1 domain-containing protein n=1 Tax=Allokutzneria oryzae TaxID=1378989 RepID=A0ABV5ZQZ9_9PSEU